MHVQGYWVRFMNDAGNAPGVQEGDVIVTLIKPVGGVEEIRVPSREVVLAAEAGNLIGLQVTGFDGRHLFVSAANLAGVIDAPLPGDDEEKHAPARAPRSKAGTPSTPD
jgi:hypothetical protein